MVFDAEEHYEKRISFSREFGDDEVWEVARIIPVWEPAGAKIIDIGGAPGVEKRYLEKLGYDVTILDNTVSGADYCGNGFVFGDAKDIGLYFRDGYFDAALCCSLFNHMENDDIYKVLKGTAKILKPGGLFFLSMPVSIGTNSWRPESDQLIEMISNTNSTFDSAGFGNTGAMDDFEYRERGGGQFISYQAIYKMKSS